MEAVKPEDRGGSNPMASGGLFAVSGQAHCSAAAEFAATSEVAQAGSTRIETVELGW
jgi:hypothetical protein